MQTKWIQEPREISIPRQVRVCWSERVSEYTMKCNARAAGAGCLHTAL